MRQMASSPDNPALTPPPGKGKRLPARDTRKRKLREIARRVKDGTYEVDADAVAERIMHKHFLAGDKDRH